MKSYDPSKIEKKWQKEWARKKIYKTEGASKKKKYYVLDMFPYPSGEGLHVGHPKGYIATDILSRMKRMQGFNVLHPMGFDAFGLPAENYAIKTKTNPEIAVKKNVARFKKQLEIIGLDYDWSREINTTDPRYYKWTQWIFLKLLEKGLAYESDEPVNWCPVDKTVLANEDVENGKCERCGAVVEKKPMRQWVLKITDYADRLLEDLDAAISADGTASIGLYNGEPLFTQIKEPGVVKPKLPFVERNAICAVVKHWSEDKYIGLKWKKVAWKTLITGGQEGKAPEVAALEEIQQETGYQNLKFIKNYGKFHSKFFHVPKGVNRFAHFDMLYFELKDGEHKELSGEEASIHEVVWLSKEEMSTFLTPASHIYAWQKFLDPTVKGVPGAVSLLDWPESIKESQRNWIGRSEGAEIGFEIQFAGGQKPGNIPVFTTRADTLFGATALVLSPEHLWVKLALDADHVGVLKNAAEVRKYVEAAAQKTEIERTNAEKEKTGVKLEGVWAVNPATKEKIPMFVADYVLADYGTGAVMSVPAHDERDFKFAQKYDLPVKEVVLPNIIDPRNPPIPGKNIVPRNNVHPIVRNPKTGKYLALKWHKFPWTTFPMGGVEEGEDAIEAARREVKAETGFLHLKLIKVLPGRVRAEYFAAHKDVNRVSFTTGILFDLENEAQAETEREEHEKFDITWLDESELTYEVLTHAETDQWREKMKPGYTTYTGEGVLVNSGEFNELTSEEARQKITDMFGKKIVKYKLRDWVFSRQRYWGEPIPVLHQGEKVVPLTEKDLPLKLPKVKSYEPTGTGESPLASISSWVNVKRGKEILKRETNTMPQWAGSSWYYLRYMDPKNNKKLVDLKLEKYWNQVDHYVGGAEHATRHLIYARFWHKFLYDLKLVSTKEPFKRLQSVGLIMGPDGRKMSKRFGNVINPDDIVKKWGADSLRLYEMFMGPFTDAIAWNTDNMIGVRRFLERVWKLSFKVSSKGKLSQRAESRLQETIKKVTEDIGDMKFNTAISSLMICLNELEKESNLNKDQFGLFLQLLAPFAPHAAEELWKKLGQKKSIHLSVWPQFNPKKIVKGEVTIAIQVNGKVRAECKVSEGALEAEVQEKAFALPEVKKWIDSKEIKKVVFVPGKILNVVL